MDEQQRIRETLARLTAVLAGIAATVDEKNRERCPYKTVGSLCTYSGGCQNQLWDRLPSAGSTKEHNRVILCTGDQLITWSPAPSDQRPEPIDQP